MWTQVAYAISRQAVESAVTLTFPFLWAGRWMWWRLNLDLVDKGTFSLLRAGNNKIEGGLGLWLWLLCEGYNIPPFYLRHSFCGSLLQVSNLYPNWNWQIIIMAISQMRKLVLRLIDWLTRQEWATSAWLHAYILSIMPSCLELWQGSDVHVCVCT